MQIKTIEDVSKLDQYFSGFTGYMRMRSKRTSDLDAVLWFCSHVEEIKKGLVNSFIIKAFNNRFGVNIYKDSSLKDNDIYTFSDLDLYGDLDSPVFKTLLENGYFFNQFSGISTGVLKCGDLVFRSGDKQYGLVDIKKSRIYSSEELKVVIIKADYLLYDHTVYLSDNVWSNTESDSYGHIFKFCEHYVDKDTTEHKELFKKVFHEIIEFTRTDKNLLAARIADWYLGHKMDTIEFMPDPLKDEMALIRFTEQMVGFILGDEVANRAIQIYDVTGSGREVFEYIRGLTKPEVDSLPLEFEL